MKTPSEITLGIVNITALLLLVFSCGTPENEDDFTPPPPDPKPINNNGPVVPPTQLICPSGTPYTYENFGEGFMLTYCTSCHSSGLIGEERFGAPDGSNFDTPGDILMWRQKIMTRATGELADMPPGGYIANGERSTLTQWLNCGAPGNKDKIKQNSAPAGE